MITIRDCGLFISHLVDFHSQQNKQSRNNSSVHGFRSVTVMALIKQKPLCDYFRQHLNTCAFKSTCSYAYCFEICYGHR